VKRFLIFLLGQALFAQPVKLSLRQAVEIAGSPEGNARIQLARGLVRQAEARSAQARAALLPNFDAAVSELSQTRNLAAFGLRINLPIAGFSFPAAVGPYNVFDARVSGNQTVFDFSSIRRYQASKAGVRVAEAETDSARDQVAAQVASLYMQALASEARVQAAEANVALAEAVAQLARNRKEAGTGIAIEVTRAEVQLADARQRLLVARNGRRQAQLQLLRGMDMRLDAEVALDGSLSRPEEVSPEQDLAQALTAALASRADLKAQQTRERNAGLTYSATKLERLPSLAGFADYGSSGSGIGNSIPTRTYGLSLKLPLFDGGRRDARRSESLSLLRQEAIRTGDLRQQIELELRLALDNLESARDQVKVADEGLAQAERETEQAQRRFVAGVANSLEPTDAQARLERARENRISALLAFNLARVQLAQARGSIRQMVQ
jgi:outer membrane protein